MGLGSFCSRCKAGNFILMLADYDKSVWGSSWLLDSKLHFRFAERVVVLLLFVAVTAYLEYYLRF